MSPDFALFPEAASSVAGRVDRLYIFLLVVSAFFTLLICALILTFGVRYRRGSKASRENPPTSVLLEITWSVIPLMLTMVMFAWGATIYFDMRTPPPDALVIDVVGKQWMWKAQHAGGPSEINALHVPVGQPVRLRMISEDVIHSFYIPAFRVKQDVLPGYYTSMWFQPTRTGEYHLFCAEYCGTEHSRMRGTVYVQEPEDYARWLAGESGDPPAVAGQKLFESYRCGGCHKGDGSGPAPSLVGLFGRNVPLTGGGMAVADEQYIRNSILDPARQVVAGFQPLMPTFRTQLSEAQVLHLIAYIRTLGEPKAPPAAQP